MERVRLALDQLKSLITGWQRVIGAGETWSVTLAPGVTGVAYESGRRKDMPWRSALCMGSAFVNNGPSESLQAAMRTAEMVGRFVVEREMRKTGELTKGQK